MEGVRIVLLTIIALAVGALAIKVWLYNPCSTCSGHYRTTAVWSGAGCHPVETGLGVLPCPHLTYDGDP